MFGFSFGELMVLVIVGVVVIGPKELPKVLRRLGQWAGKMRRMASELRAQSGIDEVLQGEGIADDIREIRRLARGELDQVHQAARLDVPAARTPAYDPYAAPEITIERDREYPREGADGYRALPDTAIVYAETLPKSALARDALYLLGDANAELRPEEAPPEPLEAAAAGAAPEGATETRPDDHP